MNVLVGKNGEVLASSLVGDPCDQGIDINSASALVKVCLLFRAPPRPMSEFFAAHVANPQFLY